MDNNPSSAQGWLERTFLLSRRRTSLAVEARAGLSTFLVMAYIIFVNPTILGDIPDSTGATLPSGAVLSITCLAAGVLSILMGLLSNYPFALAPGMGLNAVVSLHLVGQLQLTWVQAMTVVFLQGLIILVLVLTRFREAMMDAIPTPLKKSIGAGIGLFLAIIGFSNAGLISRGEGGTFSLGNPDDLGMVTFLFGFFLTLWLMSRGVQAALLWGILSATLVAILLNSGFGSQQAFGGAATMPSSLVGSSAGPDRSRGDLRPLGLELFPAPGTAVRGPGRLFTDAHGFFRHHGDRGGAGGRGRIPPRGRKTSRNPPGAAGGFAGRRCGRAVQLQQQYHLYRKRRRDR